MAKRSGRKEVNLEEMVLSGPSGAYEALQLYRSRANRHMQKNEFREAILSAANGAKCLLANNYETAGAELAELFVDLLTEASFVDKNSEMQAIVLDIESKFPADSQKRVEFLKSYVKYSIACGPRELGDTVILTRLATSLWDMKDKSAPYFFAAGESPIVYNAKIQDTFPLPNQQQLRDQALTVGVINFLALENLRDANELNYNYRKDQKSIGYSVDSDLLKFCDFLLQTCRRDAAPLFKQLVNTYASILDFDESVPTLLMGPIAVRLFNIKPKVNPMMSMLQSMLS